jgi:hypothetical protein
MSKVESMMGLECDFGYEHTPGIPSTDYGFGADAASPPQIVIQTPATPKAAVGDILMKTIAWGAILGGGLFALKKAEEKHVFKKFPKMLRF